MFTEAWSARGHHLTLTALESRGTGAAEAFSITGAGTTSLAGLGLTGIWSQALAAAGAAPIGLTHTAEPARCIMADSMAAGLVGTGMVHRQAERRQGARWTEAAEAIFPIHTRATLSTRAGGTLIDLHIAEGPCKSRLADTIIAVDAITTDSKRARVAGTIINVDLTVHTCSSGRTAAEVLVHQVQTFAPIAAGLAAALIHLALTACAGVAWGTSAREASNAVDTAPVVAGVRRAVIHVSLTQSTLKALCTVTLVAIGLVHTLGTIPAGSARTFIHIQLTRGAAES